MGKRKGRKETQETPILPHQLPENGEKEEESGGKGGAGFFACYLLTSLCPRYNGHTYIGYTVNPRRRIRQHNGEIRNGARQTKCKRPWEMVLCIYGFPTNIAALQFEWAWQYPLHSLAVRSAAASFKSLSGIANQIKLAYTMLTLPAWQRLNLTVNLLSTKYQKFTFACPALPHQMRTQIHSMDDLPCYNKKNSCDNEFEQEESREVHNSPPSYNEENENQEISHGYDAGVGLSGCLAGTQVGQPMNLPDSPPYRQEDQGRSFCTNNSPAKSLFSFTSSFELSKEFDEAVDNQSATALVAEEDQALIKSPDVGRSQEVEMIDLLTPLTCYATINSGSKKKRRATPCPEIIEPSGCFGRNSTESTLYREDDRNSPADKTFFSFTSSFKLSREFDEAVGNRSATALVADEDQALMKSPDVRRSQEVELIDLLTPSTCYAAINSSSKKKRSATPCPEIIEPSGCFVGISTESTIYREEDHNSPADKTSVSFTSSFKLSKEFDVAVGNRSATALVADEDQVLMKSPDIRSQGVEIIDLFTPSPCHLAVYSGCKKKRKPTLYPEIIIDLTNSPLYA